MLLIDFFLSTSAARYNFILKYLHLIEINFNRQRNSKNKKIFSEKSLNQSQFRLLLLNDESLSIINK